PAHGPLEHHRAIADADDRIAERMRGIRRFAGRAQHEPEAAPREEAMDRDEKNNGGIDEDIQVEQHGTEERDLREAGDGEWCQAAKGRIDVAAAEEGAQARAEDAEGETGRDLVGLERQRE